MGAVIESAVRDATMLADIGFPCLMVENFGDVPFFPDRVPPETVAAMTLAVSEISRAVALPLGINVLRNDALAALGIAAATGAAFIRVNVLVGTMYTDQGPIVGRAAEVARARAALAPHVEVWADVMVKHSTPPPGLDAALAARDTMERGLADAVIVSGSGTGQPVDPDLGKRIREAVPGSRLVIGSGATPENLEDLTSFADTVIVGTSIKVDGDARNPVDPARAAAFRAAAASAGLI